MKAKLLRILRREAEQAITTDEITYGHRITVYIANRGETIAEYEGHACDADKVRRRADGKRQLLMRYYILDKLQKLK